MFMFVFSWLVINSFLMNLAIQFLLKLCFPNGMSSVPILRLVPRKAPNSSCGCRSKFNQWNSHLLGVSDSPISDFKCSGLQVWLKLVSTAYDGKKNLYSCQKYSFTSEEVWSILTPYLLSIEHLFSLWCRGRAGHQIRSMSRWKLFSSERLTSSSFFWVSCS